MSEHTTIEWTDSTFSPWIGCTKISPACDHCYAATLMDTRMGRARWGAGQPRVRTSAANWRKPLEWNRWRYFECADCQWRGPSKKGICLGNGTWRCPACFEEPLVPTRQRVFCASLADVFDNEVEPQWRADLFALIAATPNLDWLLLTKRIGNAHVMLRAALAAINPMMQVEHPWPWRNVWLGATICSQAEADRDIPKLLATPAAVRFLSIEPMLGPIDLERACDIAERSVCAGTWSEQPDPQRCMEAQRKGSTALLDWVIAGGESGPHARPSHPDWFRVLRDQCAEAGVPFLFKQWGEWQPLATTDGRQILPFGDYVPFAHPPFGFLKRGKHAAGRELDGVEHTGFPA